MLNEVFAFLPGGTIIHKMGVVNKHFRAVLQKQCFLWDSRIVTLVVRSQNKWPVTQGKVIIIDQKEKEKLKN